MRAPFEPSGSLEICTRISWPFEQLRNLDRLIVAGPRLPPGLATTLNTRPAPPSPATPGCESWTLVGLPKGICSLGRCPGGLGRCGRNGRNLRFLAGRGKKFGDSLGGFRSLGNGFGLNLFLGLSASGGNGSLFRHPLASRAAGFGSSFNFHFDRLDF